MPAIDPFSSASKSQISGAVSLTAISPNDAADLDYVVRMIYVGTGGDISVTDTLGNTVTHVNAAAGSYIGPFSVARVNLAGTTAADLVGYV